MWSGLVCPEDNSEEFLILYDIWFGRVDIKNLRISGCLFKCDGQYVEFEGARICRALLIIIFRSMVLVVLEPQEECFKLLKLPPEINVQCLKILAETCNIYYCARWAVD